MCYVCLVFFAFILVLLSLEADTRSALVVTPIWFVLLAVTYQFVRSKRHPRSAVRNG
ncbi:D-serine/D-alanine/glycine transporter [compost metagenome]